MLINILIGLAAVIALFLIYAALRPANYEISREITLNARREKVFPFLNTRSLANSWNPFLKNDPTLKVSFEGPEVGVGAVTKWADGKQTGTGSATVTESVPNEKVTIRLDYVKPFVGTQEAVYLLQGQGNQSVVTWKVSGKNAFFPRLMCMFMNMDKMVGGAFEQGLAELKTQVEK